MPLDKAPYPGLRSFRPDESDIFFGRDECIDAMLSRLATTRFLVVLGSSGIGKSSLEGVFLQLVEEKDVSKTAKEIVDVTAKFANYRARRTAI